MSGQAKRIESVLTIVGVKVVYGAGEFERLAPPPLPVSPGWSPVGVYGGYEDYRKRTDREIPVVVLEPRPTG